MFDQLEQFLIKIMSYERVTLIKETFILLYRTSEEKTSRDVQDMVKAFSIDDTDGCIDYLNQYLIETLIANLLPYGIKISPESVEFDDLETLSLLLRAIQEIDNFDDPQRLLGHFEAHEDQTILFAHLIADTVSDNPYRFLDVLEEVKPELLTRIYDVLKENLEEFEEEKEQIELNPNLVKMKKQNSFNKVDHVILTALAGAPGTLSLSSILRLYGNRAADLPVETIGYTWNFMLFISRDGTDLKMLFDQWGKHFLEETQLLDTAEKVKQAYREITVINNDA